MESSQELAKCKDELKSLVNYPEQYESLQDELDRVKKHYTLLSNHFGELANHLLGSDWYAANSNDTDGANTEILETIKERYPDVNYSMSRMFKEIKNINTTGKNIYTRNIYILILYESNIMLSSPNMR